MEDTASWVKQLLGFICVALISLWGWFIKHITNNYAHGNGTNKITRVECDAKHESLIRELQQFREDMNRRMDRFEEKIDGLN